jgi:hypothetical protein
MIGSVAKLGAASSEIGKKRTDDKITKKAQCAASTLMFGITVLFFRVCFNISKEEDILKIFATYQT